MKARERNRRIKMLEDNMAANKLAYDRGEITFQTYDTRRRDVKNRITELRADAASK